jgi:3-phenylpropionate/trans-cinnamate dioxygenase ferredoxin reductase component
VTGIVIVGAGLAGFRAAQSLRRDGFCGELIVVGDEIHRPYDRPPLSKQLLAGNVDQAGSFFAADELDVRWMLGHAATGLNTVTQIVFAGDHEIPYDRLVVATGRRARQWPNLPEFDGFHMLRGLDDAHALRAAIRPETRVAIIGAGFIGCEVAATLRGLGVERVTLIEMAPYPMPITGPEVGARAIALHKRHGVRLLLSRSVAGFQGDDRLSGVVLADGELIEADIALLALGSVPNSEWLADSGITLLNGNVLCDEHCFAIGTDNVVAAGDVAAYPYPHVAGPICVEHWSNAREMGAVAATNLLKPPDLRQPFRAVPTFWSDQYDVKIKSVGLLGTADSYRVVEDDPVRPALVVEAYRQTEMVGAIAFNRNKAIIEYQRQLAAALAV